jgi:hypothetical protein
MRREARLTCDCESCRDLKRFLEDPHEREHRFRAREDRRRHLEGSVRGASCDLDLRTERQGSPYTLVCTKNSASYQAKLQTYQQDQQHLAALRTIQAGLPK